MLALFTCAAIAASKGTIMATARSFNRHLGKAPYSLVLFQASQCVECNRIITTLDALTQKFDGKVTMIMIDIDVNTDIKTSYRVNQVPSIGLFAGTKFLRFYNGEYTQAAISEFCESLFVSSIDKLDNLFDVFEYQKKKTPCNIIVANPELFGKAESAAPLFPGLVNFALLENQEVAQQLGIKNAQINRPTDFFTKELEDINDQEIISLMNPKFDLISSQDKIGNTPTPFTVIAIIDEHDPLHLHEVTKLYEGLGNDYEGNLSFQACDYFKCQGAISKMNGINFGTPMFILASRVSGGQRIMVNPNPEPELRDLKVWLDNEIKGIEEKEDDNDGVPRLLAKRFMSIALDAKKDVILLMAAPQMPGYKEAHKNARHLIELFRPYKNVKVFEFNPRTQLVPGLQMPRMDRPMFSVWPAKAEKSGVNFGACQPLPAVVDEAVKVIQTKIDPAGFKAIGEKIKEIMMEE